VPIKDPKAITEAGVKTGVTKAKASWDKALVAGFLAGAYKLVPLRPPGG